jgi:hypothetical protein
MNKITLADIKVALKDKRFRDSLPSCLKEDLIKWQKNPGCGCNIPFYKKIILEASDTINNYYPDKTIDSNSLKLEDGFKIVNNFLVINCSIHELEKKLKSLDPGSKQMAVARYEDQVTVVINNLD